MAECGGCRGEGRHQRWCIRVVGAYAARLGLGSERLETLGDMIGANNPELSNYCYSVSGRLKEEADRKAAKYMELNGTEH